PSTFTAVRPYSYEGTLFAPALRDTEHSTRCGGGALRALPAWDLHTSVGCPLRGTGPLVSADAWSCSGGSAEPSLQQKCDNYGACAASRANMRSCMKKRILSSFRSTASSRHRVACGRSRPAAGAVAGAGGGVRPARRGAAVG